MVEEDGDGVGENVVKEKRLGIVLLEELKEFVEVGVFVDGGW